MKIFRGKTPSEIAMDVFSEVPPPEIFLGISKTSGHLEILREKGNTLIKGKKGKTIYL